MEKYTIKITIEKLLENTSGPKTPCHKVEVESNGLTLEETIAMQTELAPALIGFVEKDAPQGDTPAKS